jgi:hypothetical protein
MALILNLSLRSNGKDYFEKINSQIIQLLIKLVDHTDPEVKSYVNCILYSLLNRESFKKEATRKGLKSKLEKLLEQAPPYESQK